MYYMIFPLKFYMWVRPYFWTIPTLSNTLSFITFINTVLKKHYSASIKFCKVDFHSFDNCFSLKPQNFSLSLHEKIKIVNALFARHCIGSVIKLIQAVSLHTKPPAPLAKTINTSILLGVYYGNGISPTLNFFQ